MNMSTGEIAWLAVGLTANACFAVRLIIQWWASERQQRSVVPISFWYLSIVAASMMMAYGIYKRDPVIIIGQWGLVAYCRNIVLYRRELARRESAAVAADSLAVVSMTAGRSPQCTCRCTCAAGREARAA